MAAEGKPDVARAVQRWQAQRVGEMLGEDWVPVGAGPGELPTGPCVEAREGLEAQSNVTESARACRYYSS